MVSVVVTTYNGAAYITQQLDSFLAQTLKPDEVLLFDDGSTDGTPEILRDYIAQKGLQNNWQLVERTENLGYGRNFLDGIKWANGDLVFLCDQDDVWYPEKIETMVAKMDKHPELAMLSCRVQLIDEDGQPYKGAASVPHIHFKSDGNLQDIQAEEFIISSFVRGCTMCLRRSVVDMVQADFQPDILGHDFYLCVLASVRGRCAYINRALMGYRIHAVNLSISKPFDKAQNRLAWLEKLRDMVASLRPVIEQKPALLPRYEAFLGFLGKRIRAFEKGRLLAVLGLVFWYKYYAIYAHSFVGGMRYYLSDVAHYWAGRHKD